MKDFIIAALPFIIIGISLAIICANGKNNEKTYLSEGIAIGMCLGVSIASAFHINLGLGISLGMLLGEALGISFKKK